MNSNFRFAAIIAIITSIWMLTGVFRSNRDVLPIETTTATKFKVKSAQSTAVKYRPTVSIQASTKANRVVRVSSELDGAVEHVPIKEGVYVNRGDVLCKLKDDDRNVQLVQAKALKNKSKIDYEGALSLKSSGFQSASQIAAAKANLAVADAQVKSAQLALAKLNIVAPFSGIFETQFAEEGDFLQRGEPCAELLELDPILVVGRVSEDQLSSLSLGAAASVVVASVGSVAGRISYISKSADDTTKTYRVEIEIDNPEQSIVGGLSARMSVALEEQDAHLISPSLLTMLGDGIGLKVLNDDDVVEIKPVSILGDDENGVWVDGLARVERIITVGQEYVLVGESVVALLSNTESNSGGTE